MLSNHVVYSSPNWYWFPHVRSSNYLKLADLLWEGVDEGKGKGSQLIRWDVIEKPLSLRSLEIGTWKTVTSPFSQMALAFFHWAQFFMGVGLLKVNMVLAPLGGWIKGLKAFIRFCGNMSQKSSLILLWVRCVVGEGREMYFWKDLWVGEDRFWVIPCLYHLSSLKNHLVAVFWSGIGILVFSSLGSDVSFQ